MQAEAQNEVVLVTEEVVDMETGTMTVTIEPLEIGGRARHHLQGRMNRNK
jgi:hypothetical protein